MEYTNAELGSLLENMATKEDVHTLKEDVHNLEKDIREVKTGLATLTESVDGMKGYAKELDDHGARITVLEEHPNLQPHSA